MLHHSSKGEFRKQGEPCEGNHFCEKGLVCSNTLHFDPDEYSSSLNNSTGVCLVPTTCLTILQSASSSSNLLPSGYYKIDPFENGEMIPAYCDLTSSLNGDANNGGWTLIRSFAFGMNHLYKYKSFTLDFPRHSEDPSRWDDFSYGKAISVQIAGKSTQWRATCNMELDKPLDQAIGPLQGYDPFHESENGKCVFMDFINVGGTQCYDCWTRWWNRDMHFVNDASKSPVSQCGSPAIDPAGIYSQDNWGFYKVYSSDFSCCRSDSSTSNWWLR
eukprot:gb/GECH01001246.1/.p1 GENE.gb/GECH01001246.1/~~gb/GECH01001246.1/.p1  ORF type:complete len:273 (+),score=61.29 gb/GECH01001246.1/:1-819(+)